MSEPVEASSLYGGASLFSFGVGVQFDVGDVPATVYERDFHEVSSLESVDHILQFLCVIVQSSLLYTFNMCSFVINPVSSIIQPNRQDKYSFDTYSLAPVFLLTRSHRCPIVPPGQPDHRSTKGPVSHHVARPQSTNKPRIASQPRPQDKRHTIHGSQFVQITLPVAVTLQFGNIASVRTPTGRTCSRVTQCHSYK